MKLKANQTVHVSSVGAEVIHEGATFEVNDSEGAQLVKMGYASLIEDKAAPPPANKMQPAPVNKGAPKGRGK